VLKKIHLLQVLVYLALGIFLLALVLWMKVGVLLAGKFILLGIVLLFISFYLSKSLKPYLYTLLVSGFALSALLFPAQFTSYGDIDLTLLITPLIQFVMFGMGCTMTFRDFMGIAKSPRGVFVGLACQLTIMPLSGTLLAFLSQMPSEVAAGIILVGCAPSGVASNVLSYLAKANLPLSISITVASTLLAPFSTPLLMRFLAGTLVEIAVLEMMWNIAKMVLVPIGAGLLINHLLKDKAKFLHQLLPLLSMLTIAVVIAIITASGKPYLVKMGGLLLALVVLHNVLGLFLGYFAGRILGMDEKDSRTISIEVGSQNGGLAGALAGSMGKIATMGLAPAVFSVIMNITGSLLASFWRASPPEKAN
jgi:bile acid:Na+ symporter, BASS family